MGPLGRSQLSSSLSPSSLSLFLSSLPVLWPGLWVPLIPPSFHTQPIENQIANLANPKSEKCLLASDASFSFSKVNLSLLTSVA